MSKSTAALALKIAFCSAFDIFRIVSDTEQQHKSLCPKCSKYPWKMEVKLFRSQLTSYNRSMGAMEEQHGVPLQISRLAREIMKKANYCEEKLLVKHSIPTYFSSTRNIKSKSSQGVFGFPQQNKGILAALSNLLSKGKHQFQACTGTFA